MSITARLSTTLADHYRIERHLGEGGMANVYLADDLKHERKNLPVEAIVTKQMPLVLAVLAVVSACTGADSPRVDEGIGDRGALDAFVTWAREHAIPVTTIDPGQGFDDLRPLKEIIGTTRVVGLGESIHSGQEFFRVRRRLFEFFVEELGFTAFAMETGFAEAVKINDYVLGVRDEPDSWKNTWFTWGFGAEEELIELVRWMRRYNEDSTHHRRLHFYGLDVPTQYTSPLAAIEEAWRYLDEVDPDYADSSRQTLLPLVEPFLGQGGGVRRVSVDKYDLLPEETRNAYAVAIGDLIARFETWRVYYVRRSSEEAYEWAYRQAVFTRQLDRAFREWIANDPSTLVGETRESRVEYGSARDAGMGENLVWALEREGPDGRIAVWAHNSHLQKYPMVFRGGSGTVLGEYAESMLGDDYLSIGFTYSQGVPSGWAAYQTEVSKPAPPGSLDEALARVGLPMFMVDLRRAPRDGPVHEWLDQEREQRTSVADRNIVNPARAWDVLFHIDRISPARVVQPPRN
jgi:erythromycin esterase